MDYPAVMGGPPWKASSGMTEEEKLFVNAYLPSSSVDRSAAVQLTGQQLFNRQVAKDRPSAVPEDRYQQTGQQLFSRKVNRKVSSCSEDR